MEERLYNGQLSAFLSGFDIKDYAIPNFGATRKLSLYSAGIKTANDISKLRSIKIQGIGSKFEQNLFSWQRQVASRFIYHPDNGKLNREYLLLVSQVEQIRKQLEVDIKNEYRILSSIKIGIHIRQSQLTKHIAELEKEYWNAKVNYDEFSKFVKGR